MQKYQEIIEKAENIIREAQSHIEHGDNSDDVILDYYYEDLDKLNLKKEDKNLYRIRLDFILYTEQF